MSDLHTNNFPKLHNAAWPGVVGKGPDSEPPIDLDTMLDLTAAAEVDGVKFDGADLFLYDPHIDIDIPDDDLKVWADKFQSRGLAVGTVVAPIWEGTGGGSAMDVGEGRRPANTYAVAIPAVKAVYEQAGLALPDVLGSVEQPEADAGGREAADEEADAAKARRLAQLRYRSVANLHEE